MSRPPIGVLGATSLVGGYLLEDLLQAGFRVIAFSRRNQPPSRRQQLIWAKLPHSSLDAPGEASAAGTVEQWICLAPIWVLPEYFDMLLARGVKRVVALSSTSRFSKADSSSPAERHLAGILAAAEARMTEWAQAHAVEWTILYPTLIYGGGRDQNLSEMARFIRRFHCFPLLGPASGLRQPVFAGDVADACRLALFSDRSINRSYPISGAETLSYREMASRVFQALGMRPRFVRLPLGGFRLALKLLQRAPRFRHWNSAMAERMNQDLVFDHSAAARDIGFKPRPLVLNAEDLPDD